MPRKNEGDETDSTEETMPPVRVERKPEALSTEGLVKMKRGDRIIHAHHTTLHDHKKNGWKEV
jgi:hypothetical protein